jgi:hypothetical protein
VRHINPNTRHKPAPFTTPINLPIFATIGVPRADIRLGVVDEVFPAQLHIRLG